MHYKPALEVVWHQGFNYFQTAGIDFSNRETLLKEFEFKYFSKELFKRNDKDLNVSKSLLNFRIHNEFEVLNTFRIDCIS